MVKMKIFEKYMERQSIKAQTRGHWVSKAEREEMMKNKKMASEKKDTAKFMEQLGVEYTWSDKFLHLFIWIWVRVEDAWRNFRYRCQRFRRGYSDYDVWDFQMWLVHMLRPMLEDITHHLYTHPEDLTFEQWRAILQEMLHLLSLMDTDNEAIIRRQLGIDADDCSYEAAVSIFEERNRARGRFFELLNRWYWDLRY